MSRRSSRFFWRSCRQLRRRQTEAVQRRLLHVKLCGHPVKPRASFSDERRNGVHAVRWPFMNPAHMSLPILPSSHMLTQPVNLALQGIEPA